ncbi:MAG: ATP-dependent Clp protease ATP-binding subunit, partial [Chloroflexi bacterium]|nr:ATP-dependent Clp protease ATP-binding subunit [Chloroflexota bacterium]
RRPYSIVVFDEVEKAHPESHNMLLQIMEQGHLTDARGRKVNFQNAIIVMTSNVGADMIKRQAALGFALRKDEAVQERVAYEEMRKTLTEQLKRVFRPEFLNRVDGVIVFRALSKDEITSIVELEIEKVAERLSEHNITLQTTPEASSLLAELGYDPDYGARPLRRVIQARVEDTLSDNMLAGKFHEGDVVVVAVEGGEIVLRRRSDGARNGASADEEEALPEPEPMVVA